MRPNASNSAPHPDSPIARHGMGEETEMLEHIAVSCSIFTLCNDQPGFQELCDVMAKGCRTQLTSRQRNMTGRDVAECCHYMMENKSSDGNPYKPWARACESFASGKQGVPRNFRARPGEKSIQDLCDRMSDQILSIIETKMGSDFTDRAETCIRRKIREISLGQGAHHRPHPGECKADYAGRTRLEETHGLEGVEIRGDVEDLLNSILGGGSGGAHGRR